MSNVKPPVPELCSAHYSALQVPVPDGPGMVIILARGEHATPGYTVHFTQSAMDVFPPTFAFWHIEPSREPRDKVTRFYQLTSFNAERPVLEVVVREARGDHKVAVDQFGGKDSQFLTEILTSVVGKDGPFPLGKDGPFPHRRDPAEKLRH
jgi:hypothetical protein